MPLTDADREAIRACQPSSKPRADAEIFGTKGVNAYRGGLRSQSLGCHPAQVSEFNAHLESAGLKESRYIEKDNTVINGVRYNAGDLHIASQRDRNRILKMFNSIDRNGGYGDHTG